jgi:hypothetical protein
VTSIVSWVGVDQRRPASLYIASDSRITWSGGDPWDHGRKCFASNIRPHIFGYWSDVLFPALALPTLIQRTEEGFFGEDAPEIGQKVYEAIRNLWATYPTQQRRSFGILHGFRVGEGMASDFTLAVTQYNAAAQHWTFETITVPDTSAILRVHGSGSGSIRRATMQWEESNAAGTSRAAFSAFAEALRGDDDPMSGGGPQLVGLYRKGAGRTFGTVFAERRYYAGMPIARNSTWNDTVEWRNELFERVDGKTSKRVAGAQVHADR